MTRSIHCHKFGVALPRVRGRNRNLTDAPCRGLRKLNYSSLIKKQQLRHPNDLGNSQNTRTQNLSLKLSQ